MTTSSNEKNKAKATRRSTAGGGFLFEDLVAADLLSHFLLDMPIHGINLPGVKLLSQVKALGWAIDDLQCIGIDAEGHEHKLAISCKSNLQVSTNGLPADFVISAWSLWRSAGLFDQENDYMTLVTRGRHPGFDAIWFDIKSWCQGGDIDLAISQIDASDRHRQVFDSVRKPAGLAGELPSTSEVIKIIGRLDVYPVDFQLTPSHSLAEGKVRCRRSLSSENAEEASDLWGKLAQHAADARTGNGTIRSVELVHEMGKEFSLKAHPSISADWSRLQALTIDHRSSIETVLPNGHSLDLSYATTEFSTAMRSHQACVVIGDSGVGKSALVKRTLDEDFSEVEQVWLGPEVLEHALSEANRLKVSLQHSLSFVLERSPGQNKVLILDSCERLNMESLRRLNTFLNEMNSRFERGNRSWRIVIISQVFGADSHLAQLSEATTWARMSISVLTNALVKQGLYSVPQLQWMANDRDILPLFANLQTLGWVISAAPSFSEQDNLVFTSITEIADKLWASWTNGKIQLQRLMMRLAIRDAQFERSFAISQLESGDDTALDNKPRNAPIIVNSRNRVEFEHDLASDWSRYQHLKEIADDIPAWSALASQPLWIGALRLFGQYLLTQPSESDINWDRAFARVSDSGNLEAADLLLDALCLDPKIDVHIKVRKGIFFANNGHLLTRLLHRFFYLATTPNVPVSPFIDADLRIYMEADMREPIVARWFPMGRFLEEHMAEVGSLGALIVSKLCLLWLRSTPRTLGDNPMPIRDIMANLALQTAKTLQVKSIARTSFSSGGDNSKTIYSAGLAAAADLPVQVGAFALEMAGRRPPNNDVLNRAEAIRSVDRAMREAAAQKRTPRQQRRAIPSVFASSREELPPWPLGPSERLTHSFREVVLHRNGLTELMQCNRSVASEVLLACIIEDQPTREFGGSSSRDDNLGIEFDSRSHPTMYWKSPFYLYLQHEPDEAFAALVQLVQFAMDRWIETAPKGAQIPSIEMVQKDETICSFPGGARQFSWSQISSHNNGQLFCALDALERWLVQKIDAGENIEPWCEKIVKTECSTAFLGVLVNLGKHQPSLLQGYLSPLLEIEALYWWDDRRVESVNFNVHPMSWFRLGEFAMNLAKDWVLAGHRQVRLRKVAVDLVIKNKVLSERIYNATLNWIEPKDEEEIIEQKMLRAELNHANWVSALDEQSGKTETRINYPADIQTAFFAFQKDAASNIELTLPYRCRELIANEADLSGEMAANLATFLSSTIALDRDKEIAFEVQVAVAATLISKGGEWIKERSEVEQLAKQLIRDAIGRIAKTRADFRQRRDMNSDSSTQFGAIGVLYAALRSRESETWDRELVTILTSSDNAAIVSLMREAVRNRGSLGTAWYRLNFLLLLAVGLEHLAPHHEDEDYVEKLWNRRLGLLRSQPVFGMNTDITFFDPKGIAQRVERLLEQRRIRNIHSSPVYLKGKSRRFAGLNSYILNVAYSWLLDLDHAYEIAELLENRSLISCLWEFEAWRVAGLDGEEDPDEVADEDDEYDHPSELGYSILNIAPAVIIASDPNTETLLWRPIFNLGPKGHYAVDQFSGAWFMLLFKGVDPDVFMERWREMLDVAFASGWESGRYWYRGRTMLQHILGLNATTELSQSSKVCERVSEHRHYYRIWAESHMAKDEDSIAVFCNFLMAEVGRSLRLDGVVWIRNSLIHTEKFYRSGTGDAIAGMLDVLLTQHPSELTASASSRDSMIEIAARLVSDQVGTAMGLQRRIAALR